MLTQAQHTIVDLSDPIVAGTAPTSPVDNMLWLDTSKTPSVLKRWTGSKWEQVSKPTVGGRNLLLNTKDERTQTRNTSNTMID